ncbi:PREDICTED: glyoxysomal processing protease, glyoxysomal-like isoform X1 [Populus euphratica]|uniref:Glyoxysomal processing protease, glyoxysomal-like isoform X1 n=1 Tax=Populus euphratica TaxID=75702 RepID=A0AAJ6V9G4_POPEU|nr:PREDICTED: glyoxysomal processing protease, glyoxysomal-like isoform X1 [Populus euphratica]
MGLPEIVDVARNFAVLVRIQGPDPKGLKMRKHAFHQFNSGKTTLSASGLLLPDTLYDADLANRILEGKSQGLGLVVTVASVVEPFLSSKHREGISQGPPELVPGAHVDVMVEGKLGLRKDEDGGLDKGASCWLSAHLIRLVDVPVSSLALQSLVEASSGSMDHGWEVGWSLASHESGPQPFMDVGQTQTEHGNASTVESHRHARGGSSNPSIMGRLTTRVAILGVFLHLKDLPSFKILASRKRGDFLLAVGSPFGVLSPVHFFNSLSVGSIANCYPPRSSDISLLMADFRCLPGMEGSPVFGENSDFIGILIRPLRQKSTGAEIQLVIPWKAIATACSDLLLKEPQNAEKGIHINKENLNAVGNAYNPKSDGSFPYKYEHHNSHCPSPLPVEKAMASICLITIDEAVWASGVLLNDQGLILTNAHLLEPWRFGKTTVNGREDGTKSEDLFFPPKEFSRYSEVDGYRKSQRLPPKTMNIVDSLVADERKGYKLSLSYKDRRNIRVRLDHADPWIWCDAKVVYVCKGPLDVALLQLEHVSDQLCPTKVDFKSPSLGSKAYVIGHGLFGPRCGSSPSVCSGVVSKIVKTKAPQYCQSLQGRNSHVPAMLETTAAVHPGGSGGAVINSEGHMIGLVTSNARHGGGTVIPHLNFSIPCAVLAPIFDFAKEMRDIALLQNLDQPNEDLSSVWALMPPLPPKPTPPLSTLPESILQDNEKQVKGSRFAKFIAERDKLFRGSTQLGKAGSISNVIFPSKL